jgi:endonuclease YncB( thermonuclease family)
MRPYVTQLRSGRGLRRVGVTIVVVACLAAAGIFAYQRLVSDQRTAGTSVYVTASADNPDAINPFEVTVVDGDTIRARGHTIHLVGFDAPETGSRAHCPRERELGDRATAQLKTLIAGGGLELRLVPCACRTGTEGTPDCNNGRSCGQLRSYGRDIGAIMIQYVLAKPYICGATSCPPRASWC